MEERQDNPRRREEKAKCRPQPGSMPALLRSAKKVSLAKEHLKQMLLTY